MLYLKEELRLLSKSNLDFFQHEDAIEIDKVPLELRPFTEELNHSLNDSFDLD
jgi:hypothetical protein